MDFGYRITKDISSTVLTIGEGYKKPRGGISAVINTYSKYFEAFKFVSTYNLRINKYYNVPYFFISIFSLSAKLAFDRDIKIVHIHGAHNGSFFRKYLVFLISKFLFSKKVVYHSHGSDFHIFFHNSNKVVKALIKSFFNRIDLLICLSTQWRTFFETSFSIKEIQVLENIIEPTSFEKKTIVNAEPLRILFLGYIGDRKGIFDLLQVIKENHEYLQGKMQLIVGGNGDVKRLKTFITKNKLESIVRFEGWVSGNMKHQLLSESDVFILPSYNEGLPISILEAMSYSMPIISTCVGGITEIVHDNVNGHIIDPGDKTALFKCLRKFIENKSLIQEMGNKSENIISRYYPKSVIPKLENLYLNLLRQ